MPLWIRNNILDFLRAMSVKRAVENGKICNKMTMGERLKRMSEVWIIDEMDSFRLDSVKKMERRFRSTTPDMRALQGSTIQYNLVLYDEREERKSALSIEDMNSIVMMQVLLM